MPAIQAMRSDALAMRAKEDVQEKIPSFFNSVSQALGQNIIQGQDNAEQLVEARFSAANALAAQIRQQVDGQGGIAEMAAGAGIKLISSTLNTILSALQRTTTTDIIEMASAIANFIIESRILNLQWEAVAATHAQWVVQAGYAGQGDFFNPAPPGLPLPVTRTFSQWLESAPAGAGPPNPENPATVSGLAFSPTTYGGTDVQVIPTDMVLYTYTGTKVGGGPDPGKSIGIVLDSTTNQQYDSPTAPLFIDGDTNSVVMYSPSENKYYIRRSFQQTFTPGAPATAILGATLTNPAVRQDFDITTAAPDPYPAGYAGSRTFYIGKFLAPAVSDGMYAEPARPLFAQAPLAIGGRGALKYRDAFTPRYTSRAGYANSALGPNYYTYYGWGSVGSITRIGQYP